MASPSIEKNTAPGWPGIPPRWTSSAKSCIGTSLNNNSRVWFTVSHGILNEIYYPRVDQACIRDMELVITGPNQFFSEEKRDAKVKFSLLEEGVPGCRLVNTCNRGRYRIEKEILTDPDQDVVLQKITFIPLKGKLSDYHVHALLAPHIANHGSDNTAWQDTYKGTPMLFAERDGTVLALACSAPWIKRSVGFVGTSDGWQDLKHNHEMLWSYQRAERGNVALTGQIDLDACQGVFILSLGFGRNLAEAGFRALSSLQNNYAFVRTKFIHEWTTWQNKLRKPEVSGSKKSGLTAISAAILRAHEAKNIPGGLIASLSIPWGESKGDDDLGGYHLVWPRDQVEAAGGLLAVGAHAEAHRVLHYLQATQEGDGHWPQNMWLDGTPYWDGIQLDETAFPILLVDLACREKALEKDDLARLWPMIRKAAGFIVRNGPVTQQDRWEEDPGYSPFTLAVEVTALLAAAELAETNQAPETAAYLRETADLWNATIEQWTYVRDTDLAKRVGVEGYYVRIAPPEVAEAPSPASGYVPIKNRPAGFSLEPADHIVSPDALALVRFGLRDPRDPRIRNTIKVIDSILKENTPSGPVWHRYNSDGYGEHEDGSPFDGTGSGQGWPLLTGERAHYELAAGNLAEARRLLKTMERFANEGGLIPEQIWTLPDVPSVELFTGRASGSAMPLVWAHAEYLKLVRSLADRSVFDMPAHTFQRYLVERTKSPLSLWRFNQKCRFLAAGTDLRIELLEPAALDWDASDKHGGHAVILSPTGLGTYKADLPTAGLPKGTTINFTFSDLESKQWEGVTFQVLVS